MILRSTAGRQNKPFYEQNLSKPTVHRLEYYSILLFYWTLFDIFDSDKPSLILITLYN